MKIRLSWLLFAALVSFLAACAPRNSASNLNATERETKMNNDMSNEESFRSSAPEAAPAPKIELGEFQRMSLKNGLELIIVENHKLPKVSFQLYVDRPPVKEGDQAGYVDIAGDLLKTGTSSRSKAEIDEEIDFIGASLSTNSKGATASCLTHHTEKLLEVLSDVILRPSFPEEEFEKAIKQKRSAILAAENDPSSIASNIRKKVNFGDHPYSEFATGETVNNIELEQCKSYYEQYFLPNISYLVVVGDITSDKAYELTKKYFGEWEDGRAPEDTFSKPDLPDSRQVNIVDLPSAVQSVINITFPVDISMASEDYIAANVMNNILGGGVFSGYLMQNLREDKGFTYGARSQLSDDPYIGYFNAYANVRNEVTDSAVVEFLREMNRIRNEKVAPDHLDLVKKSMSGSFARSLESPQNIARQALAIARFGLPEDFFRTYLQRIEAVSTEEIQRVAKKYIHPSQCNILVVGNKDEVASQLKRFDGDESITYYAPNGKKIDILSQELPEGLTAEHVIKKYLNAIGGEERLKKVESLKWVVEMDLMSMQMEGIRYIVRPGKYADISEMNGTAVRKMVYNNGEGFTFDPRRGKQEMDAEDLEQARMNAFIFREMYYNKEGYSLEVVGIEQIEDDKAYKLRLSSPDNTVIHEFYDMKSGLKLKEVSMTEGPNGPMPVTTRYEDYQEVEGILFPSSMSVAGPFPEPMKMKTKSIEINPEIEASVFNIEQ